LTVLAGPNGAGKSTILQALDILGYLVRGTIAEMLDAHGWDYSDLPHLRSARQTITIEVELEIGSAIVVWRLTLGTRKHAGIAAESVRARGFYDMNWRTLLDRSGRRVRMLDESSGSIEAPPPVTLAQSWLATLDAKEDAARVPGLLAVRTWAEGIHAFWSLDPSTLRSPSRVDTGRIGSRGEDLASFLFRLSRSQPKRFAAFVKRVRHYYPRLVQVEPKAGQYGWKKLEITERWNGERATFNARQVSDGLLRMMVVASLPEWSVPPSLVLLDEVENGLHPHLLGGVAELLAEISSRTQVLTTTHSPITLNYVPVHATRLVTRGQGGVVVVTPLAETKNFDRLHEQFDPGELWYNVGEARLIPSKRGR
jgi:predicted ATPase